MAWYHALMRRHTDANDPDMADSGWIDSVTPLVDTFCKAWFGLEVEGLDLIPDDAALVVGNHNSGITFLESMGFGAAARLHDIQGHQWRALAHDHIVDLPVLGPLLVRIGAVRASHEGARRIFEQGRKVLVFPGGNREAFRPWTQRNTIAFGGRKGWARLALRHGVPVVPVVFHGGHNGLIVLRDGQRFVKLTGLKRLLRVDTWPLYLGLPWGIAFGPWFHIPLPVKCRTRVLPPIGPFGFGEDAAADDALVDRLYTEVTHAMQEALTELAQQAGDSPGS